MRSGVFGITVVCVVLAVAIMLTIVLDVQTETREAIGYNYITDTTGLFDYDRTPQYMDYDLAKNYTGYYTSQTEPYWGGVGEKGDGYYTTSVNRYILNLPPTTIHSETDFNLSTSGLTNERGISVALFGASDKTVFGNPCQNYSSEAFALGHTNTKLSSLINKIITDNSIDPTTYNKITITPTIDSTSNRVLFCDTHDYYRGTGGSGYRSGYAYADDIDLYKTYVGGYNQTADTHIACLSCVIDYITNTVKYYSTAIPNGDSLVKTLDIEDATIVFAGQSGISGLPAFGDRINILIEQMPDNQYLDIKEGVRISGGN